MNDMASYYNFGVEIEAIAEPHNWGQPVTDSTSSNLEYWYEKLAAAQRNRRGTDDLALRAAESKNRRYRKRNDRNLQWWITWDGSLVKPKWPEHPGVPLEAVSPKLPTNKRWEDDIDAFWDAMLAVFFRPRRSSRCGSHVHVSPGERRFHLSELKAVAFAVVFYNAEVQEILHRCRRNADYCRPNVTHSRVLQGKSISEIAFIINDAPREADLVKAIQGWEKDDRKTLWNFQNVTSQQLWSQSSSGTVEFRGGRCLRGPVRTKRWIAFAIAFIVLAIEEYPLPLRISYPPTNIQQFWSKIRNAASHQGMEKHLPVMHTTMNDSSAPDITDNDVESDTASVMSIDPPNGTFIPQSAFNSTVNTPIGSDLEDY